MLQGSAVIKEGFQTVGQLALDSICWPFVRLLVLICKLCRNKSSPVKQKPLQNVRVCGSRSSNWKKKCPGLQSAPTLSRLGCPQVTLLWPRCRHHRGKARSSSPPRHRHVLLPPPTQYQKCKKTMAWNQNVEHGSWWEGDITAEVD